MRRRSAASLQAFSGQKLSKNQYRATDGHGCTRITPLLFDGVNPDFETPRIDALCIEWRQNGQDEKVAWTHRRVQTAGRRTDEDLPKHSRISPGTESRRTMEPGRGNAPSGLHKRNLVSPEFFDQREGLRGKACREELAPPGVRAVIFRMPVEIGLQRASGGFRLVDHPHTGRQSGGEEIGDQRVVGAAENYAPGCGAEFSQQFAYVSVDECV